MRYDSWFRQRFLEAPALLSGRRQRRTLRRAILTAIILLAVGVGAANGLGATLGDLIVSVGLAFAGLIVFGMAGLFAGILLTGLTILVYNGILNGRVSLIDLDYVDELPLIFVAASGAVGIFMAVSWHEIVGLAGWGVVALVVIDSVFKRPPER